MNFLGSYAEYVANCHRICEVLSVFINKSNDTMNSLNALFMVFLCILINSQEEKENERKKKNE